MSKIIQYHSTVIDADAIGYSITSLHRLLLSKGWDSAIYCSDANSTDIVQPISLIFDQSIDQLNDTLIIVHFSFYDDIAEKLASLPVKKVLVYHNITPGWFFAREGLDGLANACDGAREQLKRLSGQFDLCVGDSEFNSDELLSLSFQKVRTIPVFVNTDFFSSDDLDESFLSKISERAGTNMVFVGRFVPNKGIFNTISVLSHYVRMFGRDANLHLVGKIWDDNYYKRLIKHAEDIGVAELVHTYFGLDARKLKTLLGAADAFVSMSEHEGFMVPVVEAFAAGCPVIANDAGAVRGTMGRGGIVLDQPDPALAAGLVRKIKMDRVMRDKMIRGQARRAFDFRPEKTFGLWLEALNDQALT